MIVDPTTVGKSYSHGGKTYIIAKADNFEYTDPIDKTVSKKQASYKYFNSILAEVRQVIREGRSVHYKVHIRITVLY